MAKAQAPVKISPAQHVKRFDMLKGKRFLVEESWRKAYDNTYPLRGERIGNDSPAVVDSLGSAPAKTARRKLTITPARRAQLKLQGQYLGYMRGLKPR